MLYVCTVLFNLGYVTSQKNGPNSTRESVVESLIKFSCKFFSPWLIVRKKVNQKFIPHFESWLHVLFFYFSIEKNHMAPKKYRSANCCHQSHVLQPHGAYLSRLFIYSLTGGKPTSGNRPTKTGFALCHSLGFTSVGRKILIGSMKKSDHRFLVGTTIGEFSRLGSMSGSYNTVLHESLGDPQFIVVQWCERSVVK